MQTYTITLTIEDNLLSASASDIAMGAMYDNMMHKLVFVRPKQFADYQMLLYFRNDILPYNVINRGIYNDFVIPNTLMISNQLELQVAFQKDQNIMHSSWIRFQIGASSSRAGVSLEPMPLPSGPPGPQGPVGEPGLTVSVNGVAHTGGDVLLTAEHLPYREGTVASALDRVFPWAEGKSYSGSSISLPGQPENALEGIALEGRSTQKGEPGLSAPVDIAGVAANILVGTPLVWTQGGISGSTGQNSDSDVRVRTDYYIELSDTPITLHTISPNWQIYTFVYNKNKVFSQILGWTSHLTVSEFTSGYIRIVLRNIEGNSAGVPITPADAANKSVIGNIYQLHQSGADPVTLYGFTTGRDKWDTRGTLIKRVKGYSLLSSNENWAKSSLSTGDTAVYECPLRLPEHADVIERDGLCNRFRFHGATSGTTLMGKGAFTLERDSSHVTFRCAVSQADYPTLPSFTALLNTWEAAGNPLTLWAASTKATVQATELQRITNKPGELMIASEGEMTAFPARLATTNDLQAYALSGAASR